MPVKIDRALVTGAAGFIGSHVVKELAKNGTYVLAFVRPGSDTGVLSGLSNIEIIECDMNDYGSVPALTGTKDVDAVFHMAWEGVSGKAASDEMIQLKNVKATVDMVNSAIAVGAGTFIGCGSMHEKECAIAMASNKITGPSYAYAAAKTASHWMAAAKCSHNGIRFFWPFINTYGEGESSNRLINYVIKSIYKNESPELSEGTQYYDYVHVEDVARALRLIAEKGVDQTGYVIGSGNAGHLRGFLELAGKTANRLKGGTEVPLGFGKRAGEPICLPGEFFDITKLSNDTGFQITIPFEEGIERTARWLYEESKNDPDLLKA